MEGFVPAPHPVRSRVALVLRRLERTSFRDRLERNLLAEELERTLAAVPTSKPPRAPRGRDAALWRESVEAARRVGSSLAHFRSLEPDADEWRSRLGELKEQISTLLATEEDRLEGTREH